MKGEIAEQVYSPLQGEDWFLVQTNKGIYSLRLGGYRKEPDGMQTFGHETLTFPFAGSVIKDVLSDDFWLYILLENDAVISHGEGSVNAEGETSLTIDFENVSGFDDGFFASDELFALRTGDDGRSERCEK